MSFFFILCARIDTSENKRDRTLAKKKKERKKHDVLGAERCVVAPRSGANERQQRDVVIDHIGRFRLRRWRA